MDSVKDFKEYMLASRMGDIENVVIVGSGKGGVGKSTVTAMLALRLRDYGMGVGVLDVDLHSNSIPYILGVGSSHVEVVKGGFRPAVTHGVKVMSLRLFVGNVPVPLRGERKDGVIRYLLSLTLWGRLNYLLVDLPPGMGDELLTLVKYVRGKHVVVTVPSRTSLDVAVRYMRLLRDLGYGPSVMVVNNVFNVEVDGNLIRQYVGNDVDWVTIPFVRDVEVMLARGIVPDSALRGVDEVIKRVRS